jgi:hypothetical protein
MEFIDHLPSAIEHTWVHPEDLQLGVPVPLELKVIIVVWIPHSIRIISKPMQHQGWIVIPVVQAVAPPAPSS